MNQKAPRFPWAGLCAATLAAWLTGCADLQNSLALRKTVLVKMPFRGPIEKGEAGGWHFRHVLQAPEGFWRDGQWYVAWNHENPLSSGPLSPYWISIHRRAPEIADAACRAFHAYPILIEPNRTFARAAVRGIDGPPAPDEEPEPGVPRKVVATKRPSVVWPSVRTADGKIDPLWHLDDAHSQLASARRAAGVPADGRRIRIGHLDNGYDRHQSGLPRHMLHAGLEGNAVGLLAHIQGLKPDHVAPGDTNASHGTGTLGVLAGGRVKIHDPKGQAASPDDGTPGIDLGGAPEAEVISLRVAPWVASLNTAELAYSIDYASRVKQCDVISMSHGGAPTQAWVDAVNAAYERGTAMFAAEADFISIAGIPIKPRGILVPSSPAYPAGFRRVIGVTGATARDTSYATNSYWSLLRAPWALPSWALRGSYGADGTSSVIYRPNRKPDPSQTYRQGELRPQPIAGYAPNIPWLARRKDGKIMRADGLGLDGGGTSAATPQVAAAAALWLQKHRHEFRTEKEWRSWRKAEAVYFALLRTADRKGRAEADRFLGAGTLKARRALDVSYADARSARKPGNGQSPAGSLYWDIARDDYFDGARSLPSFFGFGTWKHVPFKQRAELWQETVDGENRTDALTRLYYNMGLLREWHGGDIPEKRYQKLYWDRAKRHADNAPAPTR